MLGSGGAPRKQGGKYIGEVGNAYAITKIKGVGFRDLNIFNQAKLENYTILREPFGKGVEGKILQD